MFRSLVRGRSGLELCRRLSSYPQEPLDRPIPGLANPNQGGPDTASRTKDVMSDCRVTRLDNGLRVASQEAFGQYSTIGGEYWEGGCVNHMIYDQWHVFFFAVLVDAGCRYEVEYTSGISHFLHKLAFQVSSKKKKKEQAFSPE